MHGDEIDRVDQFRVIQPEMPRLRGTDRRRNGLLDCPDVANHLVYRLILAVHRLVADDHPHDLAVILTVGAHQPIQLGCIEVRLIVDPGAQRNTQAVRRSQARHLGHRRLHGIGSNPNDVAGEQCQVSVDLGDRRKFPDGRILFTANGRERDPGNLCRPRRLDARPVDQPPQQQRQHAHRQDNRQACAIHQVRSLSRNPLIKKRIARGRKAGYTGVENRFTE